MSMSKEKLALYGGAPVRTRSWPSWPIFGREEEEALLRVVRSGKWGRLDGQEVARFEQEFALYHDCRHGVAVVNGSDSLRIALLALDIQSGDEVIVPPFTFLATASAVVEANAVPVFVDIHPDSYCLDPARVAEAITPRTRAIIVVHLGGQAADMDALLAIAQAQGIAVIEDAAHAHGGAYNGRKLGSLGDIGSFSFQSSKNLNAGEGGILTTNNDELAGLCRSLHNCGRAAGGVWYEHLILGGNSRLTEMQGALLSCQLTRLGEQTRRRDANGRYLNEKLAGVPGIRPLPRGPGESLHAYHLYVLRFDPDAWDGISRDTFIEAVQAEGIPLHKTYDLPLYEQPVFARRRFGPYSGAAGYQSDIAVNAAACPVTERACKVEGCCLGQTVLLGDEDNREDVLRAIEKVYQNRAALRDAAHAAGLAAIGAARTAA